MFNVLISGCKDTVFQWDMKIFQAFFLEKGDFFVTLLRNLIILYYETDKDRRFCQ